MALEAPSVPEKISHRSRVRQAIRASENGLTVRELLRVLGVAKAAEAKQVRSAVYLMARCKILVADLDRNPRVFRMGRAVGRVPKLDSTAARAQRREKHRLANIAYRQRMAARAGLARPIARVPIPPVQTVEQWQAAGNNIELLPSRVLSQRSARVCFPELLSSPMSGFP